MKTVRAEEKFFGALFDMLETQLGVNVELVLYEIDAEGKASIADIRNGQISNGAAGIGAEVLAGNGKKFSEMEPEKLYNQISSWKNGSILRSSAMFIYDAEDCVIGCLCVNQDITKTLELERTIHNLNQYHGDVGMSFAADINSVLENMLEDAAAQIEVPYSEMNKEQKIKFIRYLDQRGAFLVTKAGDRICALLGISKYTMYTYLDIARSGT